jgi:hypothetical protein
MTAVDGALALWFAMAALSVVLVVQDLATRTPAMTVMKWGWALVVLYTGPVVSPTTIPLLSETPHRHEVQTRSKVTIGRRKA